MYASEKVSKPKSREDLDVSAKKQKQEDLEVTGVSRSGRVRKKSSKLTDFESPDDLEPRPKKTFAKPHAPNFDLPPPETHHHHQLQQQHMSDLKDTHYNIKTEIEIEEQFSDQDSDAYDSNAENESNLSASDANSDGNDIDESPDYESHSPSQGVYLQELSRKKTVTTKDGKLIVRNKAQRKDKGKSRFTAYMLWAKGVRNKIIQENPQLDFSSISRKLGELWSTVPNTEKYNWRRRAKRMAMRVAKNEDNSNVNAASSSTSAGNVMMKHSENKSSGMSSQFLNRSKSGGRSSNTYSKKQQQLLDMEDLNISSHHSDSLMSSRNSGHHTSSSMDLKSSTASTSGAMTGSSGMYKVTTSTPIDVAAHLRLLGENLSIIGERLKEHEGQIAVSGSLSVLLDSLLCSIGPLVCLSQEVPELNANTEQQDYTELLDNIAYVMPGL